MAMVLTFLLGMGNFAWHSAVMRSGHRMVQDLPQQSLKAMRFASMSLEFVLLCGALYAASIGHTHWLWAYLAYSLMNGGAAWLIVSRKI